MFCHFLSGDRLFVLGGISCYQNVTTGSWQLFTASFADVLGKWKALVKSVILFITKRPCDNKRQKADDGLGLQGNLDYLFQRQGAQLTGTSICSPLTPLFFFFFPLF